MKEITIESKRMTCWVFLLVATLGIFSGCATNKQESYPIKLMKIDSKELGKYGDPIGKKICGVETESIQLPTRLYQWQIQKIAVDAELNERQSAKCPNGSDSGSNHEAIFAAQPPWSSVNNCTI